MPILQNVTVQKIIKRDFKEISIPATVKDAVEIGVPMVMVSKVTGKQAIIQALEFEIIEVSALVTIDARLNVQKAHIPIIAETIFEQFKTESIEDFKLAFRKGVTGFYGEIYRLDGAVIVRWIQCYLEEKYSYVETLHEKDKGKDPLSEVNYKAFHDRLEVERQKMEKEKQANVEKKHRQAQNVMDGKTPSGYVPLTPEQIAERKIHKLWIHENFDKFGKKKSTWMEEQEWIEKNTDLIKTMLTPK